MPDPKDFSKTKLPPWNGKKPALWLQMCEDCFDLAGVPADGETGQKTRAILIARELPLEVTESVEAQIVNFQAASRYTDLKAALLAQHGESPEEAWIGIRQMTLGDQKPSALGQAMLAKMPGKCPTAECGHKRFFFKQLFEEKLPTLARNGLVGTPLNIKAPTDYLDKADQLMASIRAKQATGGVNAVGGKADDDDGETAAVGGAGRPGGRGGGRGGQGGRGGRGGGRNAGGNGTRPSNVCPNHHRFGKETWVCNGQAWCKMKDQIVAKPDKKKDT
jgi:uncharacterized membrane protein YgcG